MNAANEYDSKKQLAVRLGVAVVGIVCQKRPARARPRATDDPVVRPVGLLADVVPAEELGPDYIIPSVFHPDVASGVAAAVREAAQRG